MADIVDFQLLQNVLDKGVYLPARCATPDACGSPGRRAAQQTNPYSHQACQKSVVFKIFNKYREEPVGNLFGRNTRQR